MHTRWFPASDNNLFRWQTTGCSGFVQIKATQILSSFLNADVDRYDGGAEKFWSKSTSARAMLSQSVTGIRT